MFNIGKGSGASTNEAWGPKGPTLSRKMIDLQQLLNEEIEDCIDSVAKLSPLVPDYIHFNCAEIATASVSILNHNLYSL